MSQSDDNYGISLFYVKNRYERSEEEKKILEISLEIH